MTIATETRALGALRAKLVELLALHERGGGDALLAARGWIDGYMSALIDSGVATSQELLEMVVTERRRRNGPGSLRWSPERASQSEPSSASVEPKSAAFG